MQISELTAHIFPLFKSWNHWVPKYPPKHAGKKKTWNIDHKTFHEAFPTLLLCEQHFCLTTVINFFLKLWTLSLC